MKKSIGLTANISEYRPNLPQTRHLNYFMGTNPVHMANGGDVRAGIPSYPDANVTRGFLPAALGFDNGGEADKDTVTKIYDFIFGYFKNVFGLDDEEAKKQTEETIQDPEKTQEIIEKIAPKADEVWPTEQRIAPKADEVWPPQTVTPIDTVTTTPSDRQPGIGIENTMPPAELPIEVIPEVNNESVIDDGGITTIPPISQEQIRRDEQEQGGLGIEELKKFKKEPEKEKKYKFLDLNKDGVVDGKDLEIARNNPLYGWAIKLIEGIIGGFDDLKPDETPKVPEDRIAPKADEIWPTETKDEPTSTDDTDKGGITSIDKGYPGEKLTTTEEATLGQDEQKIFKKTANIAAGEDPDKGGITDKKDVPAWALPLMSAGFTMMASKSPYFLQALGEGGQKGLETYTGMKEAELTGRKTEAEIKKAEAMAEWYSGGGAGGKPTIITDSETGRRVYAIFNKKTKQYDIIKKADDTPLYAVRSNTEIDEYLSGIHLNWATMPEDEKNKYRQQEKDRDLNIALTNVVSGTEEEGNGWLKGKIGKVITGIGEGLRKEKDGGIVSLRK